MTRQRFCMRFVLAACGIAVGLLCLAGGGTWAAEEPAPRPHLLIVAPKQFVAALDDFVRFKSQHVEAEVRALEDILGEARGDEPSGRDDAEKLKRFFHGRWSEGRLEYVLLVGDVDVMPVRYMTLDRKDRRAFNYAFYPSDLYYADLAKRDGTFDDWNGQSEGFHAGYFGEVRGETHKDDPINFDQVDFLPEIAVGRWPVSSVEEARQVAEKSMRYERQVLADESPHLRRAALVAVGGWVDTRRWFDLQARHLDDAWTIERRYFSSRRRRSDTPPPTRKELRGLFDQGAGLVVHAGHGQPDQWEQCLLVRDLDRIDNAQTLPIVVSAGCNTANFAPLPPYTAYVDVEGNEHAGTDHGERFDEPPPPPANYQTGRFNSTGLGEQFLRRNDHGAAAYIGCNTGSQPCGLTLVAGFIEALSEAEQPRLGTCWSRAVEYYYERQQLDSIEPSASWYPPAIFFQPMKFMLFGDPSLRLPASND